MSQLKPTEELLEARKLLEGLLMEAEESLKEAAKSFMEASALVNSFKQSLAALQEPTQNKGTVAEVAEQLLLATGTSMSVDSITKALELTGFTSNARSFYNVVTTTLTRNKTFVRVSRGVYDLRNRSEVQGGKHE